MDILISSNLERLLFETTGDGVRTRTWMRELAIRGYFQVDFSTHRLLQQEMLGDWVDNQTCLDTIHRVYQERGYLIDPHTAVAWEVADRHSENVPMVVVSTAHWSKFPADVVRALRRLAPGTPLQSDDFQLLEEVTRLAPGTTVPQTMKTVLARSVRFSERVAGSGGALEQALRNWLS